MKLLPISKLTRPFLIRFFSDPRKRFCKGWFSNKKGACCFFGHLNKATTGKPYLAKKGLNEKAAKALGVRVDEIININDGRHSDFQQRTPRARILAALRAAGKGGR